MNLSSLSATLENVTSWHRHICREHFSAALQKFPCEGRCCKLFYSFGKVPDFFFVVVVVMKGSLLHSGRPGKWSLDFPVILITG